MKRFSTNGLIVEVGVRNQTRYVDVRGRSTDRQFPNHLLDVFQEALGLSENVLAVEFHFEHLIQANSQTIGYIISVVGRTFELTRQTKFFYNPERRFQRHLFSSLEPMLLTHPHVSFEVA